MNRRNFLLTITLILITSVAVPVVMAQSGNVPQALVNVQVTVLRDAPSHAAGYVESLAEGSRVSLLNIDDSNRWFEVETADGTQGWGRALHFSNMSRARTIRTLTLFESPNDNINFVTSVQTDEQVLILGTNDTGNWSNVLTLGGLTGWTETILLRSDYGIANIDGVALRTWPGGSADEVATLDAFTPVIVEDTLDDDWARVRAGSMSGWASTSEINVYTSVTIGQVILTQSEGANLRELPAADAASMAYVANGETILIVGRTEDGRWLLAATGSGNLAWISNGLVTYTGGVGSLDVVAP